MTKLVTNLVITNFGDKFFTEYGDKIGDHQIRHQIWWHQICHQTTPYSYLATAADDAHDDTGDAGDERDRRHDLNFK